MLKVLEILAYPIRYGGIDMFVWQLIKSVDKSIHIDCLTPLNCVNEDFRKDLSERGGDLFELNLKKNGNLNYAYRPIKSFLKEHHYDVVHIHASSIQELAAIAAAASSKDTKVIVHSHGTGSKFTFVMRLFRSIAGFSMNKHVDCYCACSKVAAEWKYTPKHQKQAHIIINGIDTKKFMFDPKRRKEIRDRLKISDSEYVLGNVGRLTYEKNQSYLINIFEKFLQIKPDAKLVLVGDGPDRDALVKLVEQKGLNERIIFAGNTTDVAGCLMAMDVFVFPSVHEAFGFAVVEAQASGLPVLASDILPDDVKMCESVRFLPIGDENISKWIDAIPITYCEDRKKGVEAVRKAGFDIKNTAKQVEKLFLS
jgi:glycosyltransferase involved in cell wall biosynthesis